MGQFIGTLRGIGTTVLNGFTRGLTSAGNTGILRAQQTGAVIIKQKALATGVISFGFSVFGFVVWLIVIGSLWVLIPLVFGLLAAGSSGILKGLNSYLGVLQSHPKTRAWWKLIMIFLKFWAVALRAFIRFFVFWVAANLGLLLSMSALSFLFIYSVERHLNWTIGILDNTTTLGVRVINLTGAIIEILLQFANFINPLVNMISKQSICLMIAVYDGIEHSISVFGPTQFSSGGRRLDEMGLSQAFFDIVEPFMQLLLALMNAELLIQKVVIDLFFKLGFAHVIIHFMDIVVLAFTKFGCIVAGEWCSLLELIHFWVNEYIFSFFELFCLNLCTIPDVQIACTSGVLHELNVPDSCAGSVLSVEPPGFFSALSQTRRRLSSVGPSILCQEQGGLFKEFLSGEEVHTTKHRGNACPHVRAAFHPYGHTLNMAQLDTHECYTVCARGIEFKACEEGVREYVGTCSNSMSFNISHADAMRRLDSFFDFKSNLRPKKNVLVSKMSSSMTRAQLAQALKEHVGTQFTVGGIQCDLTKVQTNNFEAIVDFGCIAARVWSLHDSLAKTVLGRRLSSTPVTSVALNLLPHLEGMRHTARIARTFVDKYDHPSQNPQHELLDMQRAFKYLIDRRQRPSNSTFKYFNKVTIKGRPVKRRRLDTLIECPPGELLCASQKECVVDLRDCVTAERYSILQWGMYYIERASIFIQGIDMQLFLSDVVKCWRDYELNPHTDPLTFQTIFITEDERLAQCIWCFPMFPPQRLVWEGFEYSLREAIAETCVAVSDMFIGCNCPMFYETIEVTLPYFGDWVTVNFIYIMRNGLILFKNIWVFIIGDWFGIFWSGLFPEPSFSREVSRVFSLYSYEIGWDMYWFCNLMHLGSALGTLIVFLFMLQFFRFSLSIFMFLVSAGMTSEERTRKWNFRWQEISRVWHELLDPSGLVARLNNKVALLEEQVRKLFKQYDVEHGVRDLKE